MPLIDEQLIHEIAAKHNVPSPVVEELMSTSRPCLYLVPYEEVSTSMRNYVQPAARTGGLPELLDGKDWPETQEPLVLTVDCAALPGDVLDIELPADGHLLFFTHIEYPPESSMVLHVPSGASATEHAATHEFDGEDGQVRVYEPRSLYPVSGLTLDSDWRDAPETRAFAQGDGHGELLDHFERAVLESVSGTRSTACIQIGGFSDPWDMAPDEGELTLLAQIPGQAVDYDVFTLNLIVGKREDIAAGRYVNLQYEQQC